MAPATKGKAGGVSATSFFDLKSELAKQAEEFTKNKATTGAKYLSEAKKTKSTTWARRDIELEEVSRSTVESARAALERKAQLYEKLRKGKSGGLSEQQYDALLVDFDSKTMDRYESDSDDVDESLTVPRAQEYDDDPVIEYEDEFGRIRTARRSEVPRHLLPTSKDQEIGDEDPSAERVQAVAEELAEAQKRPEMHYDAAKEVRAKGAAFYRFSADEETRRQQMEELRSVREETKKTREETGAVDVIPGEVEGMRAEDSGSRALEKRKREIENRRALLEAKRKKLKTEGDVAPNSQPKSILQTPAATSSKDPFAALERQVPNPPSPEPKRAAVRSQAAKTTDADAFLAQLEHEVLKKRK
ncbi:hypothetical protein F5J12DRAFT_905254 [Pisolithus orientalis]|uniref:uncharacterized protein n=1 Tax=Pisolithus orientalis TaxID=936130 RepID=UPI002223F987|nr:uncharacterized protein F5J12DRAFT_905254 [Pisolithus orientalis]KAI6008140.1 hypothetical protein F5J12DRAFT_905254 [Pisolithus orientalis]